MTTIRQQTIKKLDDLRHSGDSSMDWKDEIAEFSDRIHEKQELPGLTDIEYSTLLQGFSCPRMVSELLSDLFEEIEGL